MALEQRGAVKGCIHHSDRGVQYACQGYVDELRGAGLEISMARRGNPYDNAAAESFMKTLKCEEVYLWDYQTVEDVRRRIPYFLEQVYNQKRLHSALGYCPPTEYEHAWQEGVLHHRPRAGKSFIGQLRKPFLRGAASENEKYQKPVL